MSESELRDGQFQSWAEDQSLKLWLATVLLLSIFSVDTALTDIWKVNKEATFVAGHQQGWGLFLRAIT